MHRLFRFYGSLLLLTRTHRKRCGIEHHDRSDNTNDETNLTTLAELAKQNTSNTIIRIRICGIRHAGVAKHRQQE